jgi:hypothetical protein
MNRFKETELGRLRLEENKKMRDQIDSAMEEYERKYNDRVEKLRQREAETTKILKERERVGALSKEIA